MTSRITLIQLKAQVSRLNDVTKSPRAPYHQNSDGSWRPNIGNWHLYEAYGGVCVHRMANKSGGVTTPIWNGHVPKREAIGMLLAFIAGLEAKN